MSSTFVVPQGAEYVGAALLSTVYLLVGQMVTVSRFRKRAGVKYPNLYAEKAEAEKSLDAMKFNCAQRAHQNTLENIPAVLILTLVSATRHPIFAAATCAMWVVGRIGYTIGYTSGNPAKRTGPISLLSSISNLSQLAFATYVVATTSYSKLF